MSPSPTPAPRSSGPARLAGGRVALAGDGARLVLALAAGDGPAADVVLASGEAQRWAARVTPILDAHPPTPDVTPFELRTPWLRGTDGAPAIALERLVRGPQVRWRLLVRGMRGESGVTLGQGDVAELLARLASASTAVREAG
jgi:hypothetical protein